MEFSILKYLFYSGSFLSIAIVVFFSVIYSQKRDKRFLFLALSVFFYFLFIFSFFFADFFHIFKNKNLFIFFILLSSFFQYIFTQEKADFFSLKNNILIMIILLFTIPIGIAIAYEFNISIVIAFFVLLLQVITIKEFDHKNRNLVFIMLFFSFLIFSSITVLISLVEFKYISDFLSTYNSLFYIIVFLLYIFIIYNKNENPLNEIYKNTIELNQEIILVYDYVHKRVIFVNKEIENLLGYTDIEFKNNPSLFEKKIILKEDYPIFEYICEYQTQKNRPFILRMVTKSGKNIWTEQKYQKFYDKFNNIEKIHFVIKDISKEKETEFALISSEKKYKEIFDNAGDIILLIRIEDNKLGSIVAINKFGINMLHIEQENLSLINPNNLLNNTIIDSINDMLYQQQYINKVKNLESFLNTMNSTSIEVDINMKIIRLNAVKHLFIIARDITEKNQMKKQLHKIQRMETLNLIAGGIAHDFNNILTALIGNITLSILNLKNSGNENLELLKEAERMSYKAKDLTSQLLTFSKKGFLSKKTTIINNMLQEIAVFTLRGSNVKLNLELDENILPTTIDESQMSRVISNLIINSKQAMKDGGAIEILTENITLYDDHQLKPLKSGKYIKIVIKDNGPGIKKENIHKIFTPFFTTKSDGNGLGLASSFTIVQKHNGHIFFETEEGKGTSFTIVLPASLEEAFVQKNVEKKVTKKKTKAQILIMDDEEFILNVISKMLVKLGYSVLCAHDGSEAMDIYIEKFKAGNKIDLVIFDLTIPGAMGGKEALENLLKVDPDIKAIVSSGYSNDSVMAEYQKIGFVDILPKPYTIEMLEDILQRNI